MKILFVTRGVPTPKSPLIGIFELEQAKVLVQLGHEVIILGVDLRSIRRWRKWGISQGILDGVQWYKVDVPVGAVPLQLKCSIGKFALLKLYREVYIDQDKPDIIHAHFTEPAYMAAFISEEYNIPLVVTEHSSLMNKDILKNGLRQCASFAYNKASCLITVSGALRKKIEKTIGVKAKVIPNIISVEEFLGKQNVHDGFGYIVTANLVPIKQHKLLIDAFAEVKQMHQDVYLGIIGDGVLKDELKNYVQSLGLESNVKFYGLLPRKEIREVYCNYDCFVLPSETETFGVACVEAMVAGLPVIATLCGGPEDYVTDETGILIPVKDKDALIRAMCSMYINVRRYNKDVICEYATKTFCATRIAKEIESVYFEVLGEEHK